MIIFCKEHGWQYNAIMCYKCNRADIIIPDEWPQKGIEKPNERNSLAYPVTVEFRQSKLLEFL